jgi:hypothetical protein
LTQENLLKNITRHLTQQNLLKKKNLAQAKKPYWAISASMVWYGCLFGT